jgi:hypothetical protein
MAKPKQQGTAKNPNNKTKKKYNMQQKQNKAKKSKKLFLL